MDEAQPGRRHLIGRVAGAMTDRVVGVIDPDTVLDQVDVDALLARIDMDALLARVDLDALLAGIDVNEFLDRVDANQLLDRVDIDRLLDRVDVQRLVARVDPDELLENVDVRALVARSGIPEIVTESTSHLAVSALDLARAQVERLDGIADGALNIIVPTRRGAERPASRPGGVLSRVLAILTDISISTTAFTASYAGANVLAGAFLGHRLSGDHTTGWAALAFSAWLFLYYTVSVTLTGYTPGKRLLGIQVRTAEGGDVRFGRAAVRTLMMPVSGLVFGLGYLIALGDRRYRTLHDRVAGTIVVRVQPEVSETDTAGGAQPPDGSSDAGEGS